MLFTSNSIFYLNSNFGKTEHVEEQSEIEEQFSSINELRSSDIAGSDLYAEMIHAYVAGDKSIIKQSEYKKFIIELKN